MSDDLQPPDTSPPPPVSEAIDSGSPVEPVEAVPLPPRAPADAADVFFRARQVDGPNGAAAAPVADPLLTAAATSVAAPSVGVVVPIGEDLTGAQWSIADELPSVDRFGGEQWPVAFAFNHQQVAGSGEDSDPVLRTGRDVAVVAVFDGMGGAGGTVYETPDGPRSGAYLASRIARDVADGCIVDWVNAADGSFEMGGGAAELLQLSVQQALQARLADLRAPTSRLRSKLLRALPTTMAMVALQRRPDAQEMWTCEVLWAGDSRVYALDGAGLHQLTVDDIRDHGDAMANLREDSVVSNAMSADTPYVVNHRQVHLSEPVVLVAATDGCFGYLPSPMHFEDLLLSTLHGVQSTEQWSDAVRAAIVAVAGDDASMALAGVGADLETLKALTADRWQTVRQQWVGPLDAAAAEVDRLESELESARLRQADLSAALWDAYRPDYSSQLPTPASEEVTA